MSSERIVAHEYAEANLSQSILDIAEHLEAIAADPLLLYRLNDDSRLLALYVQKANELAREKAA